MDNFSVLRRLVGMDERGSQYRRMQVVRLTLVMAAFGWGLALTFLFSPWEALMKNLIMMGARPVEYDPFFDHWMRQTAVTFIALSSLCLMTAWNPQKYAVMIRPIAWFHGALGIVAAVSAGVNGLTMETHPTLPAELVFSFVVCIAILSFNNSHAYTNQLLSESESSY